MRIHRLIIHVFAGILMAAFCTACMERGNTRLQPVGPIPQPTISSNRVELIIRNAKQEVANLRADLGAARIAVVKKEVEAEELRREMTAIRQRVSALQQAYDQQQYMVEKQQAELSVVKADRARLESEKSVMQRELAELPALREAIVKTQMAEGQGQARVKELESTIIALKEELVPVKAAAVTRDGRRAQHRSQRQSAAVPKESDAGAVVATNQGEKERSVIPMDNAPHSAVMDHFAGAATIDSAWTLVTVKPGETLWDLAREHGATIDQIKSINGFVHDTIRGGQRLRVPAMSPK